MSGEFRVFKYVIRTGNSQKNMDVWGYNANNIEIMRRIKQQFDPNSILNPGRFVAGI